jgi:leucyl/phenylalanyl-tRNA---protein transferase
LAGEEMFVSAGPPVINLESDSGASASVKLSLSPMTIDPLVLLQAYSIGVFPMSDDRDAEEVYWIEPKRRAIMPLHGFHLSHSLAKTIRQDRFRVTANQDFGGIVSLCAQAAKDRPSTWINREIEQTYRYLHEIGFAHSIEVWDGDELAGGLYGVALGQAFFGESMVSRRTGASKVALAWLTARMLFAGFTLLDCQFMTDHLRSLGAIEISQKDYLGLLAGALGEVPLGAGRSSALTGGFGGWAELAFAPLAGEASAEGSPLSPSFTVSGPLSGQDIVQLLTQTS